jgi:hypothetical protein
MEFRRINYEEILAVDSGYPGWFDDHSLAVFGYLKPPGLLGC